MTSLIDFITEHDETIQYPRGGRFCYCIYIGLAHPSYTSLYSLCSLQCFSQNSILLFLLSLWEIGGDVHWNHDHTICIHRPITISTKQNPNRTTIIFHFFFRQFVYPILWWLLYWPAAFCIIFAIIYRSTNQYVSIGYPKILPFYLLQLFIILSHKYTINQSEALCLLPLR